LDWGECDDVVGTSIPIGPNVEDFLACAQQYLNELDFKPEPLSAPDLYINYLKEQYQPIIKAAKDYRAKVKDGWSTTLRHAQGTVKPTTGAPSSKASEKTSAGGKEVKPQDFSHRKPVVTEQKDIWEDIQPDMKDAIQDFWKESEAKKSEGKRLLIEKFCRKRHLDESTFRSEKDKVEKRKNRPGWADQ